VIISNKVGESLVSFAFNIFNIGTFNKNKIMALQKDMDMEMNHRVEIKLLVIKGVSLIDIKDN
jgi:hypothetical protein